MRTKPTGIRFDPEKVDYIKQREKLKSNQSVVDLLVNKYWWEHKLPHVTAKEAPPLELKNQFQDLTKGTNEIKPFEQPQTNFAVNTIQKQVEPIVSKFEAFRQRILKTTMVSEIEAIMREIKIELMFPQEKKSLEAFAKEHSRNFYTD